MPNITFEPKYFTYKEWIAEHQDVEKEVADCPGCDGTGSIVCTCCGNETECEECGGTGEVETARAKYKKQLAKDRALIARYQGRKARHDGAELGGT